MPQDSNAEFDQTVLDLIEHSPTGAVPGTPSYQDAIKRLRATHQVYPSADHKGGYATARSLARAPAFHAANLDDFIAGRIAEEALESNAAVYSRYVQSLPAERRAAAEAFRVKVIGKPAQHRAQHSGAAVHEPLHVLVLVPGAGPHPGLPGNYLHGAVFHVGADDATGSWVVHVHDSDDGAALFSAPALAEALAQLRELLGSAPFHLDELEALGFRLV